MEATEQTNIVYNPATVDYWESRAIQRQLFSEIKGKDLIARLMPIYQTTLDYVNKEVESLYKNYGKDGAIDVAKMREKLTGTERSEVLKELKMKIRLAGEDPKKIIDKNFLVKLNRLEAIKERVYWSVRTMIPQMTEIQARTYSEIIQNTYFLQKQEIKQRKGNFIMTRFDQINKTEVQGLLEEKWFGGTYGERTKRNMTVFGEELRDILGTKMLTGISVQKTAKLVEERFNVSKYEATRLVRTESTHFANKAEMKSYEDEGIKYYKFVATLDGRTSDICKGLNGTIWRVEDAVEGYNYPPCHSQCRSTTVAMFPEEVGGKVMESNYKKGDEYSSAEDILSEIYETNKQGYEEETGIPINR